MLYTPFRTQNSDFDGRNARKREAEGADLWQVFLYGGPAQEMGEGDGTEAGLGDRHYAAEPGILAALTGTERGELQRWAVRVMASQEPAGWAGPTP